MKTRISVSTFALVVLLSVLVAAIPTHGLSSSTQSSKVLIRSKFVPGRVMRYNLKLSGSAAWAPHEKGLGWGKMDTDFTFDLATKVIRESGACTFHLAGQKIKSTVTGPKGRLGIIADRRKSKLKINDDVATPRIRCGVGNNFLKVELSLLQYGTLFLGFAVDRFLFCELLN